MKSSLDAILRPEQAAYLEALLPPRDPLASSMEHHAREHHVPIVDPEVGIFLYIAARSCAPKRILEIGTATGYSGLWLARALPPRGRLVTIDVDLQRQDLARTAWCVGKLDDRIETICGPALEVLPKLSGPFDMLFIDAAKTEYRAYLDLALPLLRPGAVIVADNTLWAGRIARGDEDEECVALREFNRYAMEHPRLKAVILPIADGVLYAIVD